MLVNLANKLNLGFSKCWSFLRPRRKLGLVSFVLLASFVLVVWVVSTNTAYAADILSWDTIVNGISSLILRVAGWFISLTFWILKFVIEVSGYNGFIDSPAVTVGWVMVRDVTNMFFVVVLLIISFGTILGLEQYEYKKLLVKLLIAAVIVNFSRIICGIIIDVAQVVMITFVNGIAATADANLVNMFKVENITKLNGNAGALKVGLAETFLAAVAAITFASMMMMTMLTFLFLLMARMVTLWILIVLSPFAFILNVLPQTQKYAGQWWTEFGGNVVAGPIIAFFLWLSFVTVGAGNAHQTIADNNVVSEQNKIGVKDNEEATGITNIMTWADMANFAIAIGMLLAGAKMAQQLGAAGGAMMGKAGEFGKKVAMIASGATAARWAARGVGAGAKKAGKWGLMKMPFVGGEAWKRRGQTIAGAVGIGWGKIKEKRNEAAKALERSGKRRQELKSQLKAGKITQSEFDAAIKKEKLGGGFAAVGRGVRGVLAGIVETGGRKNKRANDWMEAAKNQEKIVEENYGTSSSLAGRMKTELGVRAEQATALSEAKKVKKYGEKKEELLFRDKDFQKKAATIAETMAAGEYGKQKGEDKKLVDVAIAKDKVAEANNEETGYEIAARAAIAKRLEDQRSSMNFREITEQAKRYADKLKAAQQELDGLVADKASEEDVNKAQEVVAFLGRQQMATITSALNRGSEVGLTAIEGAAGVAGFNENIGDSDETGKLRKLFSGLMSKNFRVDMSDVRQKEGENEDQFKSRQAGVYRERSLKTAQEAEAQFRRIHGDETANILLRNLDGGLRKTAGTGAPGWAGLLNDRNLDEKGRVQYKVEHDSAKAEENRNYYAGANAANQITNLAGLFNSQKGQVTGVDAGGMDRFIQIFKNISRTTRIDPRLDGQLKGMVGSNGQIAGTLGKDMERLFKMLIKENRQSAAILLSKIGPSFAKALGGEFESLRDAEVKASRKDKGNEDEEGERT